MSLMDRRRFLATSTAGLVVGCSSSTGPSGPLSITSASLPEGRVGDTYGHTLSASGGKKPYHWSVVDGALPPFLNLDEETGRIGGPPAQRGESTFTIRVTDARGETAERHFTLFCAGSRLVFGLYDDFDGHGCWQERQGVHRAVAGELYDGIWSSDSGVQVVPWDAARDGVERGNVVKLDFTYPPNGYYYEQMFMRMLPAEGLLFQEFQSVSADMMLDPASTCEDFRVGFDLHTAIPEQGGVSWYAQMSMSRDSGWGRTYVRSRVSNNNTGWFASEAYTEVEEGVWHNLGIDITQLSVRELQIGFRVDGERVGSPVFPPDSEILMDPERARVPSRQMGVETIVTEGVAGSLKFELRGREDLRPHDEASRSYSGPLSGGIDSWRDVFVGRKS